MQELKTKIKIEFHPSFFTTKNEIFRAKINAIGLIIQDGSIQSYSVNGSYYYTDNKVDNNIGGFSFNITKEDVDIYAEKFSSNKTGFTDSLEQTIYYLLLEVMAKDYSDVLTINDLEIVDKSLEKK